MPAGKYVLSFTFITGKNAPCKIESFFLFFFLTWLHSMSYTKHCGHKNVNVREPDVSGAYSSGLFPVGLTVPAHQQFVLGQISALCLCVFVLLRDNCQGVRHKCVVTTVTPVSHWQQLEHLF